jgi:hypothetical protein
VRHNAEISRAGGGFAIGIALAIAFGFAVRGPALLGNVFSIGTVRTEVPPASGGGKGDYGKWRRAGALSAVQGGEGKPMTGTPPARPSRRVLHTRAGRELSVRSLPGGRCGGGVVLEIVESLDERDGVLTAGLTPAEARELAAILITQAGTCGP